MNKRGITVVINLQLEEFSMDISFDVGLIVGIRQRQN